MKNKYLLTTICALVIFAVMASTVNAEDPLPNPELAGSCGIDMVLILDSSGSIGSYNMQVMKDAFVLFVDAFLPKTPTRMAVIDFESSATLLLSYSNNITDIKNAINQPTSGGGTQYIPALQTALNEYNANSRLDKPDLFIFASDGGPGDSYNSIIAKANEIKQEGIKIITLGIGGGVSPDILIDMSSALDYYDTDFATLADDLADLANELCGGTISVQKKVDGNPAEDWEFTLVVEGGTATPNPGVTDKTGFVVFDINISEGSDEAIVDIMETPKAGFSFDSVYAENCSGLRVGTPGTNAIYGIPVNKDCAIYCLFNNTAGPSDDVPPVTTKTVGTPKYGPNDEWVRDFTEFNMTATDDDSGVNATYYRVWYLGVWSPWIEYTGNFTLSGDCTHYIEFYSVDNAGNQEAIQNQTHYVDETIPTTAPYPPEFGNPQTTTEYGGQNYVMINCTTPMWINVSDPSCGVGIWKISYSVWYNDTAPGTYVLIPGSGKEVFDQDPEDLDRTIGKISVALTFDEECFHEVRWTVTDLFGHTAMYDYDFAVDCTPPEITKYIGDPECDGYGTYVSWVNFSTPFTFEATDAGCNGGAGVAKIGYEIRIRDDTTTPPSWTVVRTKEIDDDTTEDEWDEIYGEIKNTTHMTEECVHEISFWAMDYVGNKVEYKQKHLVDNTPPEIIKTVGTPNCEIIEGKEYCVNLSTVISFHAVDHGCLGGVGLVEMRYKVWNEEQGWGPWNHDCNLDGETYQFQEECKHYLLIEAWDCLGNKNVDNETFWVDEQPPLIEKSVGEPKVPLQIVTPPTGGLTSFVNLQQILHWWINCQTPITIDATDMGCCGNLTYLAYQINDSGWVDITNSRPVTIFLPECVHYLNITAQDCLGNTAHHNEIFYVDCTPPKITKTVGTPNCEIIEGKEYCVTTGTDISFNVSDDGCQGGVGLKNVSYRVWNETSGWTGWFTLCNPYTHIVYNFKEECKHYLEIYAEDSLNNSIVDNETFWVDDQAPEISKIVGEPKILIRGQVPPPTHMVPFMPLNWWINCQTPITINATDLGCCGNLTYLAYQINDSGWVDITNVKPVTIFLPECVHYLNITAQDCLGNTAHHNEIFYVDCTPPKMTKTVGEPNCPIEGTDNYYVTTETEICFSFVDEGCMEGIGLGNVSYRIWNDGSWGPWMYDVELDGECIQFEEECIHYLWIEATDLLGNKFVDNETFYVDDTPPDTVKTFKGPTYDNDYWLRDNDTWVILNTTDPGICASGAVFLHVELWWASNGNDIDTLLWSIDINDNDENDTDNVLGQIAYKFQIMEDCLHEIRWYSIDCLGNIEEYEEQIVNLFFDDFEENLDKWTIAYDKYWDHWSHQWIYDPLVTIEDNDPSPAGGCYAEIETIDEWCGAVGWMSTVVDTTGFYDIRLSYWANTESMGSYDWLYAKYRIDPNDPWTTLAKHRLSDWMHFSYLLPGADNQPYVEIKFYVNCDHDYGMIDDVLITGNTTVHMQQHRVDSIPPEIIKTVGEPSFSDDGITWWVTTLTPINVTAIDHEDPCAVGLKEILYRIWWRGKWSEWINYTGNFTFEQGCTHYLEIKAIDHLGNFAVDNETFIVHGPTGDSDPNVAIIDPTFIPPMTISADLYTVVIEATDDLTDWEDLEVYLMQPGGRRDAPDIWYDVTLGSAEDQFEAVIDDLYKYQDGAKITLQAYALDEDGNVGVALPVTFTVRSTTVWDQWMQEGWNLLQLTYNVGCNESVERILASIEGEYDFVFHYDIISDTWFSYSPDRAPQYNDLTEMEGGKQYWVHMTNEDGVRYYLGLPEIEIDCPLDGDIFEVSEFPEFIDGTAWDSQGGIDKVEIQLYFKDEGNNKHYWNGSDWVDYPVNLDCLYGEPFWGHPTGLISWIPGVTYYVKAMAFDNFGCCATDMASFELISYTISGTVFLDQGISVETGDTLSIVLGNHSQWPVFPNGAFVAINITDPVLPLDYSFDVFNGTYYALAFLMNDTATEGPYAVGAYYNMTVEDIMNDGPDKSIVDGLDIEDADIILRGLSATPPAGGCIGYPDFLAYWPDGASGTVLYELISSNDGHGYAASTPAIVGDGCLLDGDNDYLMINPVIGGLSDYTWAAWVYPDSSMGTDETVYSEGNPSVQFEIKLFLDRRIGVSMYNDAKDPVGDEDWFIQNTVHDVFTYDAWNFIAITLTGGGVNSGLMKIYVNGNEVESGSGQMVVGPTYAAIGENIGAISGQFGPYDSISFNGIIDELSIFGRALSQSEVMGIYNNGYYYHMGPMCPN